MFLGEGVLSKVAWDWWDFADPGASSGIGKISSPGPGVKSGAGCSFLGLFYPTHYSVLIWRIWKP